MSRKVLGIVGSYRKSGANDQVVSAVLAAAAAGSTATEKIYLLDARIEFYTNCRRCSSSTPDAIPGGVSSKTTWSSELWGSLRNFRPANFTVWRADTARARRPGSPCQGHH